jgi:glycosyltransferase involved in cell wall biosynthesis
VVTHLANQQGIPELKDGVNCLLSSSGSGLARKLENALRDNELRLRIQRNARNTYEKYFSEDVAAGHIVNELVGLTTIC